MVYTRRSKKPTWYTTKVYERKDESKLTTLMHEAFFSVKNTQEATLDSRLLVLSADLGNQKARNLRLESQMFSVDEFVSKIKRFARPRAGDDDEDLNWKKIGQKAFQFSARVQSIDFMQVPYAWYLQTCIFINL